MPSSATCTETPSAPSAPALAAMRSLSFTRSSPAPVTRVAPRAVAAAAKTAGNSSIASGTSAGIDVDTAQLCAAHPEIRHRLAPGGAAVRLRDVRSHLLEDGQHPGPGRIHPDVPDHQIRAGPARRRREEECGGGDVPGGRRSRSRPGARLLRCRPAARRGRVCRPRGQGRPHGRGRLHERGRRRTRPASARCGRGSAPAPSRRSVHPRRAPRGGGTTSPARWPPDSHGRSTRADHRSGSQVAGFHRPRSRSALPCADRGSVIRRIGRRLSEASPVSVQPKRCPASKPASRRSAVPAFPRSMAAAGAHSPSRPTPWTIAFTVVRPFDLHPHRPERRDRGEHVFAFEQPPDPGVAVRDRAEHDGAMGDRLVAGHRGSRRATDPRGARCSRCRSGRILSRRIRWLRMSLSQMSIWADVDPADVDPTGDGKKPAIRTPVPAGSGVLVPDRFRTGEHQAYEPRGPRGGSRR